MYIDSKVSELVLLALKFILELFSQSASKTEGLKITEKRIKRVIEKWMADQDGLAILEPLIDLLQVLDIAIKEVENIGYVEMLNKSIKRVLQIFELLGAKEIQVAENEVFNPRIHRGIDIDKSSKYPKWTIVEVCRRGFMVGESVFCPVEVIVAVGGEKEPYLPHPERSTNRWHQHSPANIEYISVASSSMLDMSLFFPHDLKINKIICIGKEIVRIEVLSCRDSSVCPICRKESSRIHSSYNRKPIDLPVLGYTVHLELTCRKFFCDNQNCERKIFTERLEDMIKPYARRTNRLEDSIISVAFSSNAETDSKIAKKLSFAISSNTFLRIIRKTPIKVNEDAKLIGVDDWAFRKGNNYGTIVCDQESHRPIALFKGRTAQDLEKWLIEHPGIILATRDRSDSYASALKNIHPTAIQVADRFHLAKNLLDAVKEYTRRILPSNFCIIEQPTVYQPEETRDNAAKLEKDQERILHEQEEKRKIIRQVKEFRTDSMTVPKIAQTMKLAKGTVRRYIALSEERASKRKRTKWHGYDRYEGLLIDLVREGKKAIEILKVLGEKGVTAGKSTIFRWVHELKKKEGHAKSVHKPQKNEKWLKRYDMTSYLWSCKEDLKQEEKQALEKVFAQFPLAHKLYGIIQDFRQILKTKDSTGIRGWIERTMLSGINEIARFAKGLQKDFEEVYNAFVYPYSNGLVEGHVNRLKMIKRMMFGRAKLDLLRQRVLYRL